MSEIGISPWQNGFHIRTNWIKHFIKIYLQYFTDTMTGATRSFLSIGRKVLWSKFRIIYITIRTIHFVSKSLNLIAWLGFLASCFCNIDTKLFKFSQYFDDIFFQSSYFFCFYGDTIIDTIGSDWKVFSRHIRRFEIKIFNGFQSLLLFYFCSCIIFDSRVSNK